MATAMTFTDYDMVITDENGKVSTFSFVNNMDILKDALEQVAPEHFWYIRNTYKNELKKALDGQMLNYVYYNYKQNIKELLKNKWDAVYAIVADKLR